MVKIAFIVGKTPITTPSSTLREMPPLVKNTIQKFYRIYRYI